MSGSAAMGGRTCPTPKPRNDRAAARSALATIGRQARTGNGGRAWAGAGGRCGARRGWSRPHAGGAHSEIEALRDQLRARGDIAEAHALDVTDVIAVSAFIAAGPPFDILVNNAGTNRPKPMGEVGTDVALFDGRSGAAGDAKRIAHGRIRDLAEAELVTEPDAMAARIVVAASLAGAMDGRAISRRAHSRPLR